MATAPPPYDIFSWSNEITPLYQDLHGKPAAYLCCQRCGRFAMYHGHTGPGLYTPLCWTCQREALVGPCWCRDCKDRVGVLCYTCGNKGPAQCDCPIDITETKVKKEKKTPPTPPNTPDPFELKSRIKKEKEPITNPKGMRTRSKKRKIEAEKKEAILEELLEEEVQRAKDKEPKEEKKHTPLETKMKTFLAGGSLEDLAPAAHLKAAEKLLELDGMGVKRAMVIILNKNCFFVVDNQEQINKLVGDGLATL